MTLNREKDQRRQQNLEAFRRLMESAFPGEAVFGPEWREQGADVAVFGVDSVAGTKRHEISGEFLDFAADEIVSDHHATALLAFGSAVYVRVRTQWNSGVPRTTIVASSKS